AGQRPIVPIEALAHLREPVPPDTKARDLTRALDAVPVEQPCGADVAPVEPEGLGMVEQHAADGEPGEEQCRHQTDAAVPDGEPEVHRARLPSSRLAHGGRAPCARAGSARAPTAWHR